MTIDGQPATVTADDEFSGTVPVTSGTNTFSVSARDASGNVQTDEFEVEQTGSSQTLTYDANGNLTADGTRSFEWDAENRLVAVNAGTHRSEFTYDGLYRRSRIVEKENGATVRDANLFWDGTEIIEDRLTTGESNRFFGDGEQLNGAARYLTTRRSAGGSARIRPEALTALICLHTCGTTRSRSSM